MNRKVLITLLMFLLPLNLAAEESRQDLISKRISPNFIPEKAFIIVNYQDGSIKQYQALLIPPIKKAEIDIISSDWIVGTYVKSFPGNSALGYGIFLKGKQNESLYLANQNIDSGASPSYTTSVDLMKQQISIRKKILDGLQVQNNTQAGNLKRLRADAEVIANLSRIVEIVDESEVVKSEIENLDKDLELLRSTFQAVKGMPQPKNYLRRELELTKQSDELIKLVNSVEVDEENRKSLTQSDIQTKLAKIEQTRYEDEDKLKQQLIRLKTGAGIDKKEPAVTEQNQEEQIKNYWEIQ